MDESVLKYRETPSVRWRFFMESLRLKNYFDQVGSQHVCFVVFQQCLLSAIGLDSPNPSSR
jgi:hypothetical protein